MSPICINNFKSLQNSNIGSIFCYYLLLFNNVRAMMGMACFLTVWCWCSDSMHSFILQLHLYELIACIVAYVLQSQLYLYSQYILQFEPWFWILEFSYIFLYNIKINSVWIFLFSNQSPTHNPKTIFYQDILETNPCFQEKKLFFNETWLR